MIDTYNFPYDDTELNADITVHQARRIANTYLEDIKSSDATDLYPYNKLDRFIKKIVTQPILYGNAQEYHNFAVELARENQAQLACLVLEHGLKHFPNNVDLISDYLAYGIVCGKEKECEATYQRLISIPKDSWTWRGFSFSIDYLQHLLDDISADVSQKKEIKNQILELADAYIKSYPSREDGYYSKANVFSSFREDATAEITVLQECLSAVKVCPKCALRCADLYFEQGDYENALKCVSRAIKDANQAQGSINEGYVFYLSGLCKLSLLQTNANTAQIEESVSDIYADFDNAFGLFGLEIDEAYKHVMVKKVKMLRNKFNIDILPRFSNLLENMD